MPMLRNITSYFQTNLFETTSGNFATDLLQFHIGQIGLDRILYSVDYPFISIADGATWVDSLSSILDEDDLLALKRGRGSSSQFPVSVLAVLITLFQPSSCWDWTSKRDVYKLSVAYLETLTNVTSRDVTNALSIKGSDLFRLGYTGGKTIVTTRSIKDRAPC